MKTHEALQAARLALSTLYDSPHHVDFDTQYEDAIYEIDSLIEAYEPYKGDPPEEAQKRVGHPCKCSNCGHTFHRMFLPGEASRVSLATMRCAVCPKCYATEGILIAWDADNYQPSMSFTAHVEECQTKYEGDLTKWSMELSLRVNAHSENIADAKEAIESGKLVTVTTMPGSGKA